MQRTGLTRRNFITAAAATLGLGACTSAPAPTVLGDGPPRVSMRAGLQLGTAPVKGSNARFAFTDITGAPEEHLIVLNRALNTEAKARKVTIVPAGDPSATYIVKGYLSAIGDREDSLLVHVWDVMDVSGRRLHRFSGQEGGEGSQVDPWSGISEDTVREVARQTIDDLAGWIA